MKFNFKKISAIASSLLLAGMSIAAPVAAANYPAPFIVGGSADVAIVEGTGPGAMDAAAIANLGSDLQSYMSSTGSESSTTATGDYVILQKTSDKLNIGDTWKTFTGTISEDDLSTLLADGTYVADDNDEFKFEQKITLGSPALTHFRDSDYESLIGADLKTPTVGFHIKSNTFIMNYTYDFLQDAESDVDSDGDLEDIEGSDIVLLGKTYYISDLDNGTSTSVTGTMTLLDSANSATVNEDETVTVAVGDKSYEVSVAWMDSDEVKYTINGDVVPTSGKLQTGQSYSLGDGYYLGVRDISKLEVSGELGTSTFSIGSGKLELVTGGGEIELNDEAVEGVVARIYKGTTASGVEKLDKIEIEWRAEEEAFITPDYELVMPGFEAVKFSMNNLIRSEEEKITLEKSDDQKFELRVPIKDGTVPIGILYGDAGGAFIGIGEDSENRLATSHDSDSITFHQSNSTGDVHKYFPATYNVTGEAESYLLKATITQDKTAGRNETDISKYDGTTWTKVCEEKTTGDTCSIGQVTLTISTVNYTSGGEKAVSLNGSSNVNFFSVFTKGGLGIILPYEGNAENGAINLTNGTVPVGGCNDTYHLWMYSEDKDDVLLNGYLFNFTLDDTSDNKYTVSEVGNVGTGGPNGKENEVIADGAYETYLTNDSVATRIVHYTKGDEDYVEIYYPTGDSETYSEVLLTEADSVISGGTAGTTTSTKLGDIYIKDTEVGSVGAKNLIIVGGSCINSAAATVIGGAYCGEAWTTETGVGAGEFLLKGVADKFYTGKTALLVAGYNAADTSNAATYLTHNVVDTGKEYKGTSSTSATLVTTETTA